MVGLLDVTVLVALLVPEHEHHAAAMDWFTTQASAHGWATCAVTERGRLITFDRTLAVAGGSDVVSLLRADG